MKSLIILFAISFSFIELFSQKDIAGLYTSTNDSILLRNDNTFYYCKKDLNQIDIFKIKGKWKYENYTLYLNKEDVISNNNDFTFFDKYSLLFDTVSLVPYFPKSTETNQSWYFPLLNKKYSVYNNGQKKIVFNYDKRGKFDKKIICYHQNGKESCIQNWSHGTKIGFWEYYDENSKLIMKERYKKGGLLYTELPTQDKK